MIVDSFKPLIATNFEYIFSITTDIGAKLCCRTRELLIFRFAGKLLAIVSGAMVALCDVNEYRHSIKLFKVRLHFLFIYVEESPLFIPVNFKKETSNFEHQVPHTQVCGVRF